MNRQMDGNILDPLDILDLRPVHIEKYVFTDARDKSHKRGQEILRTPFILDLKSEGLQ